LELTGEHNILKIKENRKRFVRADSLKIGDFLIDIDEKMCEIESIEKV
jgi:hypothetical protein